MKKLSLLVALMLIITVGGVYATWNYSQGSISQTQGFVLPSMEVAVPDNPKGTIEVDVSGLTVKIDDPDTDAEVHKAVAVWDGEIVIRFTPAVGADDIIATNGIKMSCAVSCTTPWEYDSTQIFTVDADTVFAMDTVGFELRIPAADLAAKVHLGDFTLPTHQDYLDFQTELNRGNIKLLVTEVTATP